MTDTDEKVRENRVRRIASRRGLVVQKSRRRDERAIDFGLYCIVDDRSRLQHKAGPFGPYVLSIEEVEQFLEER